ncbi:MAG: DNA-binding transcriptional regulator Fis [Candidatus Rariloculaceae bacterium]
MPTTTNRKKNHKKNLCPTVASPAMGVRNKPLSELTDEALRSYLSALNGHKPAALYQLVLTEVEKPLFRTIMEYVGGNQSEAAEILGINRGTLRKKLKNYKLLGR